MPPDFSVLREMGNGTVIPIESVPEEVCPSCGRWGNGHSKCPYTRACRACGRAEYADEYTEMPCHAMQKELVSTAETTNQLTAKEKELAEAQQTIERCYERILKADKQTREAEQKVLLWRRIGITCLLLTGFTILTWLLT